MVCVVGGTKLFADLFLLIGLGLGVLKIGNMAEENPKDMKEEVPEVRFPDLVLLIS